MINKPLEELPLNITPKALVIGGGVAGMSAALNFAQQGFETCLVEKEGVLGGFAKNIHSTVEGEDVQKFLKSIIDKVNNNDKIKVPMIFTEIRLTAGS